MNRARTEATDRSLVDLLIPQNTHIAELLQRVHEELVSINGVQRAGAVGRPVPTSSLSYRASMSPGQLAGFSFRETTGTTAATVRIRDGVDATGDILETIALTGGESARDWLLPAGVGFSQGLYVDITGTIEGTVFIGAFQ